MASVRYAGRISKRRPEVLKRVAQDRESEAPVFFLVYVSSAVRLFSAEDLRALPETCRKNNAELGVTGMLLYKDGNFMQVLEGDEEAVRGLYARIAADPRHRGEITLQEGFAEGRQFPDWSMGFRDLNSPEERSAPGYSEFLNAPLTARSSPAIPPGPRSSSSRSRGPCKPRESLRPKPRRRIGRGRSLPWKAKPQKGVRPNRAG